jgi:signal recognition particle receptor subunit beta
MSRSRKTKPFAGIKVVVAGPPNCGKADFMRILSIRYPQATLRDYKLGWIDVLRLDFPYPMEDDDESSIEIHLHALVGNMEYEAMYEMLLSNADAILMMIDMTPARRNEGLQLMIKTADCLKRRGLDIREMPMVFQYHRAELASQDLVRQWDQLLELAQNRIPRFFSSSDFAEGSFTGFDLLLQEVVQRYLAARSA